MNKTGRELDNDAMIDLLYDDAREQDIHLTLPIGENWLIDYKNEKLVESRLSLNATYSELPYLLWEVYGKEPAVFLDMLKISRSCGLPRWLRLSHILGLDSIQRIKFNSNTASKDWVTQRGSWVDYDPKSFCLHKEFEPTTVGPAADMFLSRLRSDIHCIESDRSNAAFTKFVESEQTPGPSMGVGPREEKFISKILEDMGRYVNEHVEPHITEICEGEKSRNLGNGLALAKPAQLDFEQPTFHQLRLGVSEEPDKVHMIFAVAGSGKTRSIFQLLSERYGHYLVSGLSKANDASFDNTTNGLSDSKVACKARHTSSLEGYDSNDIGSCDTAVAWSDLLQVSKTGLVGYQDMCDEHRGLQNSRLAERIYMTILWSRHIVLQQFLKRPEETRSPLKWLQFQLACVGEKDHFQNLYCIMRHMPDSSHQIRLDVNLPIRHSILLCFDEAQHDLIQDTHIFADEYGEQTPLLQQLVSVIPKLNKLGVRTTGIVSGTSLKFKDSVQAITRNEEFVFGTTYPSGKKLEIYKHLEVKLYTNFKPMTSNEQLWLLLNQQGFSVGSPSGRTYKMISQSCRRLYGRYRWSIQFITLLKDLNLDTAYVSDEAIIAPRILTALEETIRRIKDGLIQRLKLMQQGKQTELLYQLREVTIRADILGRPMIFESDEALNMVTEGFATVIPFGNSKFKSCLSEPLALESAMDFFRDHEQDLYQSRMMRFICTLQDDQSAFGKAAEWYLAWQLYKRLDMDRNVRLTDGQTLYPPMEDVNAEIIDLFSCAKRVSNGSHDIEADKILEERIRNKGYKIVKGGRIGLSYDQICGSMVQWLELLRGMDHSRLGGTFYFPENIAGPDILFALKPQNCTDNKKIILCVIQLKTGDWSKALGKSEHDIDTDSSSRSTNPIAKAIDTTNPQKWYTMDTAGDARDRSNTNFNRTYCEKKPLLDLEMENWKSNCILRILITCAGMSKPIRIKQAKTIGEEYFLWLGIDKVEYIFGKGFCAMLSGMKEKEKACQCKNGGCFRQGTKCTCWDKGRCSSICHRGKVCELGTGMPRI